MLAAVFGAGFLACGVVYPVERWAQRFFSPGERLFLECLLIPGVIEETAKLLVVLLVVWWQTDFDEPVDGLIYGTAAALGFTFGEDWRYYVIHGADVSRLITTVAHPWFSCFWAASLGWAKVRPRLQGLGLVVLGFVASVLVHALFDFFIVAADADEHWAWLRAGLVPLLIGLYWITEKQLEELQRESQAKDRDESAQKPLPVPSTSATMEPASGPATSLETAEESTAL